MIAVTASGNNNLYHIVSFDHGERSVPGPYQSNARPVPVGGDFAENPTSFPSRTAKDAGACVQNPSPV
jgi:hypothetical protein